MRCTFACLALLTLHAPGFAADPTYWQEIRPVLRKHCTVCHSAKNLREVDVSGGLALDTFEAATKLPKKPVILAGKSHDSPLVQLLRAKDEARRMPKGTEPLSDETVALLARWIDTGAMEGKRPDDVPVTPIATRPRRLLDVALATQATPPRGLLSAANPAPLNLVLKAGPLAPVTAVRFSPDGKHLAVGSYGHVAIWDLAAGKPAKVLTNVLGAVNDLRFSPDGGLLVVAGGQPSSKGDLRLYDGKSFELLATLPGHDDTVFSVAFSKDGAKLASASFDKTVRVWDVKSRQKLFTFTDHSDFVYAVAFSPDGTWLVSCSKDRSVKVFDLATGKSRFTFSGMNEDVMAVAVTGDGKQVISSGYEANLFFWDAAAGTRIRSQNAHGIAVHELTLSENGKLLASAGADNTIRLWDGAAGTAVRTLTAGTVTYAVAFSQDGKLLASGGFDGLVRLWDPATGKQLATLVAYVAAEDKPAWVAYAPEGYFAADGGTLADARWTMAGQPVDAGQVARTLSRADLVLKALKGEAVPAAVFGK
jgi:hypothetical protein